MTPQKVSDILIRIIDEDWHVYTDDAINALEYAAKVVEKEIPKKPIKTEKALTINDHKVASIPEYHCSNQLCNREIRPISKCNNQHYEQVKTTYCPWCGQKLDWEEKDDDGKV